MASCPRDCSPSRARPCLLGLQGPGVQRDRKETGDGVGFR